MRHFFVLAGLLLGSYGFSQEQTQGYILKSIYFGGGSFTADEYQVQELYDLVDSIPEIKHYTITVHSHTDNIGGAAYNEWLSNMRSETVIAELQNMEFKANQI
ncbi:MAG: OmpA family protein, partial [Ekhidna sp.]